MLKSPSTTHTHRISPSVLTWNSHSQSNADHSSFSVTYTLDDAEVRLQPGENMVQCNFIEPVSSDLVRISTGSQQDSFHDLTRLFKVPTAGRYQVAVGLTTPAYFHSNGPTLEEALEKSRSSSSRPSQSQDLIRACRHSLVQSQQTLQRRAERFRPGDCNGDQDVTKARNNAKDLARSVKGSGNAALWELYFNNGDQRATVSNVYQGVQNYEIFHGNNCSATEQCDFQNQNFDYRKNARTVAYAAGKSFRAYAIIC